MLTKTIAPAIATILTASSALAQITVENIECTDIQGAYTTIATGQVVVNSIGPAEFTAPVQSISVPFNQLTPNSFFTIDYPLDHGPIPTGATANFTAIASNLPTDISAANVSENGATGSSQTVLTQTFQTGPSPGAGVANIQITQNNSVAFGSITTNGIPPLIPVPPCDLCRSISIGAPSTPVIQTIPAFSFSQAATTPTPFAFLGFRVRTNFNGATGTTTLTTDLRIIQDGSNPYFTLVAERQNLASIGSNMLATYVLDANAPAASELQVPVLIQARVNGSCV